jgi:hypothetical protein
MGKNRASLYNAIAAVRGRSLLSGVVGDHGFDDGKDLLLLVAR